MKEINGISYFGYIDTSGKTIIETQFLNAQNFQHNEAIVLKLSEELIGKNDVLGKNIVQYKYYEVTIDTDGNINQYLTPKGFNTVLDKTYLKTPPEITSRKISDNLYAIYGENRNWTILKKIFFTHFLQKIKSCCPGTFVKSFFSKTQFHFFHQLSLGENFLKIIWFLANWNIFSSCR